MGLLNRLRERLSKSSSRLGSALSALAGRASMDAGTTQEMEDLLIAADLGVGPAARIAGNVAQQLQGQTPSEDEIRSAVSQEVAALLQPVAQALPARSSRPQVVVFVGVNGSGKTTTIGKFAAQFIRDGQKVLLAACDTYRAAAVAQLQAWGERVGAPVVTTRDGGDPAGLAFSAHERGVAEGFDWVLIDTAGRLQNKDTLMAELTKIIRVLRKRDAEAPHDVVLVLDATVGQNALSQVEVFGQAADVTGLVMTKLDGSARGGVLVAVAERSGLPVHAIGVGEREEDLIPLDPQAFAHAITGAAAPGESAG